MIPTSDLRGRKRESSTEYGHSNLLGRRNGCAILRDSFSARSRPSCGFSMRPGDEESETRPRIGRKESRGQNERDGAERRGGRGSGEKEGDACASNNDVFRCSAPYTAWRSMPVLTPAQGRSGRAGGLTGAGGGAFHGRERVRRGVSRDGRVEGTQARSGEKMNKHPEEERDEGTRGRQGDREAPRCALPPFPPAFRHSPLFFSLLCDCHSFSTIPRPRFTMHRRLHQRRASYSPSDFLNVKTRSPTDREGSLSFPSSSCLSASFFFSYFSIYLGLRDLFQERARL